MPCSLGDQILEANAVDDVHGVESISLRFGHLLAICISNQSVNINFFEWHFVDIFQRHHDHPGNPETDDVVTGNHQVGGMISL